MRSRRAWTWIGPAVMCVVDVGATLACQPDRYWREGYGFGHESNPVARWLLELGPPALVAGGLAWVLFFSVVILHLRFGAARVVALALLFGHAFGASTWLIRLPHGWAWCLGVWLLARWLFGLFWDGPKQRAAGSAATRRGAP